MDPWKIETMKILFIEDSDRLRRSLGRGLERSGYAVDLAADGREGLEFARSYDYDVIVLDLMLPVLPGLEVLRALREEGNDVHILILSAKDQIDDRVRGLEMGADDYLVKPFDFDELCARIEALVRRRYRVKSPEIEIGPLRIDRSAKIVSREGEPLRLTPKEFALLEYLALRRGRVITQTQLVDQLYDSEADVGSNVVEVLVSTLRKKIHTPGEPPIVRTRRGFGYVIE